MINHRFISSVAIVTLAATAGCSLPFVSPSVATGGHLRGFVYGAAGTSQPLGLAKVSAGGKTTFTANPEASQAIAPEAEADDGKTNLYVMHDFGDGKLLPAERRLRVFAAGPAAFDKYIYLRKGEYFFEDLPAGYTDVTASFRAPTGDGVMTQEVTNATRFEIFKHSTAIDVNIKLDVPMASAYRL